MKALEATQTLSRLNFSRLTLLISIRYNSHHGGRPTPFGDNRHEPQVTRVSGYTRLDGQKFHTSSRLALAIFNRGTLGQSPQVSSQVTCLDQATRIIVKGSGLQGYSQKEMNAPRCPLEPHLHNSFSNNVIWHSSSYSLKTARFSLASMFPPHSRWTIGILTSVNLPHFCERNILKLETPWFSQ